MILYFVATLRVVIMICKKMGYIVRRIDNLFASVNSGFFIGLDFSDHPCQFL